MNREAEITVTPHQFPTAVGPLALDSHHRVGQRQVRPEALIEFLGLRLAAFEIPARIWIVAEPLPKLGTEKVDKVSIRNKYHEIAAMGEKA